MFTLVLWAIASYVWAKFVMALAATHPFSFANPETEPGTILFWAVGIPLIALLAIHHFWGFVA